MNGHVSVTCYAIMENTTFRFSEIVWLPYNISVDLLYM